MNVFIITSPYQILNSVEAIHEFGLTDNHLVVLLSSSFTEASFSRMVLPQHWKSVRFIRFYYPLSHLDFALHPPKNLRERALEIFTRLVQVWNRIRIDRLCRSLGKVDALFLGQYLDDFDLHMRHIANRTEHRALYVLDTGTDTLRASAQRNAEVLRGAAGPGVRLPPPAQGPGLRQWLRRNFLEWDVRGVERLTFFTAYELVAEGADRIRQHSYAHLKSLTGNSAQSDEVFFIAQPLVDQQYLSLDAFIRHLARVREHFADRKLVYVVHPRESAQMIQLVAQRLDLPIRRFTVPIEYQIAFGGQTPSCISSFFSSAIANCYAMFGKSIQTVVFHLPAADLMKDHESVENVYRQFASDSHGDIEVIRAS